MNAFIVPVTKNYLHEARPLVKSLGIHMPDTDLHILTVDGQYRVNVDDFSDLHKHFFVHDVPEFPAAEFPELQQAYSFRRIRTSRFLFAAFCGHLGGHSGWKSPLDKRYDVVCLLDADMCMVRPINKFFKMAEMGTILVGCNNTLLRYTKKDFDKMHVEVRPDIDVVHPTFCTVPTFVNPNIHQDWLEAIWTNKTGNDLEIPNLLAQSMNKMNQVYHLGSENFLNIHHMQIRPETYAKATTDGLYTQTGEPVSMLHGHWADDSYRKQLLEPIVKNFSDYPKAISIAQGAINTIKQEYDKYVC
jgi:hypothetical protein